MIRVAGHFGEWLQGRLGPDGPVVLVTLPCTGVGVTARLMPGPAGLTDDAAALIATDRATAFLHGLGTRLASRIDLAPDCTPGMGTGMSTGALVALARIAGAQTDALPAACIAAEGASDPLMLSAPDRVLWASREGRVIAPAPAVPVAKIVGGFYGPAQPTDPTDNGFPDISDLWDRWQNAKTLPDIAAIAALSAQRTTALRGPADDPMSALADATGALGHIRAHTGAARGLVFEPGTVPAGIDESLTRAGLRDIRHFTTGGPT
ncbi:hypothetical protein ACMU_15650 [Actibacterium mucosum KCTC 23349]|uniref:Propanediol utilization protein n=1 Tax=Actibacterium mucosum KCTC 23349 TaxID=1454373 RepID=A0A037ZHT5_9RHOB|nr:hypothetical protein [Actibacterium mucosum]KAJ55189.1 hypothetical protein ACMU_15650 [Actibacterium mucosum KCTC 23349]